MIDDKTIVYLIKPCKYCKSDYSIKMTHMELYNLYKKLCKENSVVSLAKDDDMFLRKYKPSYYCKERFVFRYVNFGKLHDFNLSKTCICSRCKDKGCHLPDENKDLKEQIKKLKLLIVSANINKDELTEVSKFL
jgi:hypothetical protein